MALGSSPRVRGTRSVSDGLIAMRRFIPACAGNTSLLKTEADLVSVHPRVCGEHRQSGPIGASGCGSSPRVRGTPAQRQTRVHPYRFIPACAGNTCRPQQPCMRRSVHPRVCGEHFCSRRRKRFSVGSSPRVRGTLCSEIYTSRTPRFIPACAGNTIPGCFAHRDIAVHPRVCGEHRRDGGERVVVAGSSPRVRGTRHFFCPLRIFPRFIPACAGNTEEIAA